MEQAALSPPGAVAAAAAGVGSVSTEGAGQSATKPLRLLVQLVRHNYYLNFRVEELEALCETEGGWTLDDLWRDCKRPVSGGNDEFFYANFPSEEFVQRIAKRSVLMRDVTEVWAEGKDLEACQEKMRTFPREKRRQHVHPNTTFAYRVTAYGKSLSAEEKKKLMDSFGFLWERDEKIDLQNPETTIHIIEEWGHARSAKSDSGVTPDVSTSTADPPPPPRQPKRFVFGRIVADGRVSRSCWFQKFALNERPVLGPTTMDNELAFLMSNMAKVRKGTTVLDPFVGTAGLLVSASHFGAFTLGADLDVRVLKGWGVSYLNKSSQWWKEKQKEKGKKEKGKKEEKKLAALPLMPSVFVNFDYYGLNRPDTVRTDNAAWMWRFPLPSKSEAEAVTKATETKTENEIHAEVPLTFHPDMRKEKLEKEREKETGAVSSSSSSSQSPEEREREEEQKESEALMEKKRRRLQSLGREGTVPWLDAIITDPPYGMRAASRQSGQTERNLKRKRDRIDHQGGVEGGGGGQGAGEVPPQAVESVAGEERTNEQRSAYIPPTVLYGTIHVTFDLLSLASRALTVGGRLVFLLPVDLTLVDPDQEGALEEHVQRHVRPWASALRLVCFSLQTLSGGMGRILVTMERLQRS
uniref:Uncharacterized protein n=1 Tax=Chromera velia CCMP2878 TaxID=1169474 RepID=A0A0G4HX19_9ALVE|eukprot:Cvel_9174.t1-p1 / transcript=Cvel_9174.t1 / gene=Cvel_9174 / organism=Chromera_velia_CCMP2878 / gene_product=tRNA (guanine(10)-N2)-methyltransferase homolog, putative / transcript_product=tRNA (guanine(10)-N2)-methyltransferase homolog, putative / location=Cvel_scaffold522:65372-67282(-) / protein_length=637 / sequence_SO=supercontig / SO=protein_coding / is_pseudo=false